MKIHEPFSVEELWERAGFGNSPEAAFARAPETPDFNL